MLSTQSVCPERVFMLSPFDTLHMIIVLSEDEDAKYSPLGENSTLFT